MDMKRSKHANTTTHTVINSTFYFGINFLIRKKAVKEPYC